MGITKRKGRTPIPKCINCKFYTETVCAEPRNVDKLSIGQQRSYGKLSQMWYKSCGIQGLWFEQSVLINNLPKYTELLKYGNYYCLRNDSQKFLNLNTGLDKKEYWWGEQHRSEYCMGTIEQIQEKVNEITITNIEKAKGGEVIQTG